MPACAAKAHQQIVVGVADDVQQEQRIPEKQIQRAFAVGPPEAFAAPPYQPGRGRENGHVDQLEQQRRQRTVAAGKPSDRARQFGEQKTVRTRRVFPTREEQRIGLPAGDFARREDVRIAAVSGLLPSDVSVAIDVGGEKRRDEDRRQAEGGGKSDDRPSQRRDVRRRLNLRKPK